MAPQKCLPHLGVNQP
jgi:hypothetical protein